MLKENERLSMIAEIIYLREYSKTATKVIALNLHERGVTNENTKSD